MFAFPAVSAERQHYFDRAAETLSDRGDAMGARLMREFGSLDATVPRRLSDDAGRRNATYAQRYEELRVRFREVFLDSSVTASNLWRLDRAEAALHLVSYELEQGGLASTRDVKFYLNDAAWMLSGLPRASGLRTFSPPEIEFSADAGRIDAGDSVVLRWKVTGADSVLVNGRPARSEGTLVDYPTSTAYYYIKASKGAEVSEAGVIVSVTRRAPPPRPRVSLSIEPDMIMKGSAALLRWRSSDAERIKIDGEPVMPSGSRLIVPERSMRINAVAEGRGGKAAASMDVVVVEKPKPPPPVQPRAPLEIDTDAVQSMIHAPLSDSIALPDSISSEATFSESFAARENARSFSPAMLEEEYCIVVPCVGLALSIDSTLHGRLRQFADELKKNPASSLRILGYTDDVGAEDANKRYSLRRANAARDFISRTFSISKRRITIEGRGEGEPLDNSRNPDGTSTEPARARNRRVEVFLLSAR